MPKIPKLIGSLVKATWSKMFVTATVIEKQQLTATLLRIRFQANLQNASYKVGQAILIQISDTEYRNYTPSTFNKKEGYFDVIFHQAAHGPGTTFFKFINIGETIVTSLPRGKNIYNPKANYHFFYGDDTCIGFCEALQKEANKNQKKLLGILELDPLSISYVHQNLPHLNLVDLPENNTISPALNYLNEIDEYNWNKYSKGNFYLMGNGKSIQQFRKALRNKGIASENIITQPFWVDGKIGL
ncbi:MAG: oxidoreductase [Flavobacteriaceae bacterium]|jgi:NADPH-dependent ferric siderophore reductase|nr:oxidoreductase [Flavobacteriaceae bacterium]